MIRLPRLLAVALFTLFVSLGCSGLVDVMDFEAVPPPSPAYAGVWEGSGMTLIITPDGYVRVTESGVGMTELEAPAKAWHPDRFELGIAGFTYPYTLNELPYEADGEWRMVVNEKVLVRQGAAPDIGKPFRELLEQQEAMNTPVAPAPEGTPEAPAEAPAEAPPEAAPAEPVEAPPEPAEAP